MSTRRDVMVEGLTAGLIGYGAVVVFIAVLDLINGRALFQTPSLLGQILIGGFGDPTPGVVVAGPVMAYNGFHLLVFLAVGMAAAWIVHEVELHPIIWYGAFFAVMTIVLVSFMVLSFVGQANAHLLDRWPLIGANALAAVAIGLYMHRAHPALGSTVREHADPEYEETA
ncbi:MAG: hypothetical protein R3195_17825 [Gemmatimonadota bacterium]|nr:hypothetical protein [Gemmatimonadota bacterium]